MTKIFFVFGLLGFFCVPYMGYCQANTTKLDKFFVTLLSKKTDTAKVMLYLEIAQEYMTTNMDSAHFWANNALEMAKKNNFQAGMAWSYNRLGRIYTRKGLFEKANDFFMEAQSIFLKIADNKGISSIYFSLASLENRKGNFEKDLFYCQKAAIYAHKLNDPVTISVLQINIGIAYQNLSQYAKALDSYLNAIDILRRIATAYINLGNLYNITGNEAIGLLYYDSAFQIRREEGNLAEMSKIFNNIGTVYNQAKKYDAARASFQKALALTQKIGDKILLQEQTSNLTELFIKTKELDSADFYNKILEKIARETQSEIALSYHFYNSANIAIARKEYKLAEAYFLQSLAIRKKMGNQKLVSETLLELGKNGFEQNNLINALQYSKESYDSASNYKLLDVKRDAADLLFNIYECQKNWKEAAFYSKIARNLFDSLQSLEKTKIIFSVEANFKLKDIEHEVEILEKDKIIKIDEIRTLQFYIILAFMAFLLALLSVFWLRKKFQVQKLRLEKEKYLEELRRLQAEKEKEVAVEEKKTIENEKEIAIEEKIQAEELQKEAENNLDEAIELVQSKTKTLSVLKDIIQESSYTKPNQLRDDVKKLIRSIENEITNSNEKKEFEILGADFIGILSQKFPELTLNEVRICTYIRLGYSSKQIASFLNIETESVSKARNRLRKKLEIAAQINIADFLKALK